MASEQAVASEKLWEEYQTLNRRYMDTIKYIETLKQELDKLSEDKWRQICVKSLHNIRNEIVLYQMKDKKLTSENQQLSNQIQDYKKEVDKLAKKRSELQSKKSKK